MSLPRTLRAAALPVLGAALSILACGPRETGEPLTAPASVARAHHRLAPGAERRHELELLAGQAVLAEVREDECAVRVRLSEPGGRLVAARTEFPGDEGWIPVSFVAERPGGHLLTVQALGERCRGYHLDLRLRDATAADRTRQRAEESFVRGADEQMKWTRQGLTASRGLLRRALELSLEIEDFRLAAAAAATLAGTELELGDARASIERNREALEYWTRAGGPTRGQRATSHHMLGLAHGFLGETGEAERHLQQAMQEFEGLYEGSVAAAEAALADVHLLQGDLRRAFACLLDAIERLGPDDRSNFKSSMLASLGRLYLQVGAFEKARPHLEQAREIAAENGFRRGEAQAETRLAEVLVHLGEIDEARALLQESIRIFDETGFGRGKAEALRRLSWVELTGRRPREAERRAREAVEEGRRAGNPYATDLGRETLGWALLELGQGEEAKEEFSRALDGFGDYRDLAGAARARLGLANAALAMSDLEAGRLQLEEAIAVLEDLQMRIPDWRLRSFFVAERRDQYELLIDTLLGLYRMDRRPEAAERAFEVLERVKARGLLAHLGEVRAGLRPEASPGPLRERQALVERIQAAELSLANLRSETEDMERIEAGEREIQGLLDELEEVELRIRARDPRLADLIRPRPITVEELQGLLDRETLLLTYGLGYATSHLWVVGADSIEVFDLPSRMVIEDRVGALIDHVTARNSYPKFETPGERAERIVAMDRAFRDAAAEAARALLPDGLELEGRRMARLVIVPDGAVARAPFAVLPAAAAGAGPQALLRRYVLAYAPSASVLAELARLETSRRQGRGLAVIGDPVTSADDPRISWPLLDGLRGRGRRSGELRRLSFAAVEGDKILEVFEGERELEAVGFDATKELIVEGGLDDFRLLHFAAHAVVDDAAPELSGIVLSQYDASGRPRDGLLRLHDIYDLELQAEMVVLSACRTASGREFPGEGLLSLVRGFHFAGVPCVVGTLWEVDDMATAVLMGRFYREFLGGLSPAEALRQAQLAVAAEPRYEAPYYWAGFLLQGPDR